MEISVKPNQSLLQIASPHTSYAVGVQAAQDALHVAKENRANQSLSAYGQGMATAMAHQSALIAHVYNQNEALNTKIQELGQKLDRLA